MDKANKYLNQIMAIQAEKAVYSDGVSLVDESGTTIEYSDMEFD